MNKNDTLFLNYFVMGKNIIYTLEIRYVIKCSTEHLSDTVPAVLGPRFWDFAQ